MIPQDRARRAKLAREYSKAFCHNLGSKVSASQQEIIAHTRAPVPERENRTVRCDLQTRKRPAASRTVRWGTPPYFPMRF